MTAEPLATVKVFRFDPAVDKAPRYETYKVPYKDSSVLQVLMHIYEDADPTLAFREGCRRALCGCCSLLVNGVPALSCIRLAEEKMTIEPHPKFEVKKDLIVDLNKVKKTKPIRETPLTINLVSDNEKCDGCGDCTRACPVGVWEVKGGKSVVVDIESCCGMTCQNCAIYCHTNAITISKK